MKRFLPILAAVALAGAMTAQVQWAQNDNQRLLNRAQWKGQQAVQKAPAHMDQHWETLIEENFDKMTAGTNEVPDTIVITNPYIDEELTQMPEWSGIGVRQAGGAVNIGTPGWGDCILNTPEMEMQGWLRLTFRAKCLTSVKGFTVNLDYNGIYTPGVVLQQGGRVAGNDNGWREFEFEFYNPKSEPCFIQIVTSNYGTGETNIYDDFKLERTHDYIRPVSQMESYDFTSDGFSAIWPVVSDAQSYLVSLYAEKTVGADTQTRSFDLNGITEADNQVQNVPEGLSVNFWGDRSHYSADGGADGTPALMLCKEDEYIEIDGGGSRITNLTFYYQGLMSDDPQCMYYACRVDGWDGHRWQTVDRFEDFCDEDTEGARMDFGEYIDEFNEYAPSQGLEIEHFRGMYTKLRLQPESINYGIRLLIDDIAVETEPAVEATTLVKDAETTVNEYKFEGVDMNAADTRYFVGVNAVNGELVSDEYVQEAFGIPTPIALEATEVDAASRSFLANWEALPTASAYMLDVYDCQKMDKDVAGFSILAEDFNGVHEDGVSEDPDYPDDMGNSWDMGYFDAYTQQPGWSGMGNVAIEGALGCKDTFFAGMYFIQTPSMTLNNADGAYNVHIRAYLQEGDALLLSSSAMAAMSDIAEATDWYDLDFPMTDGSKNDRLIIMSAGSKTFLMDDFQVTQDLQAGDLLLTPIQQNEVMDDNCFPVYEMPEGLIGYDVLAGRQYYTKSAISDYSNTQLVNFNGEVSIEEAAAKHAVLALNGLDLTVTTTEAASVEIFNIAGQKVAEGQAIAGANRFTLPAAGAYIVTVNGKATKLMAR